jgi:hypothetical protein
MYSFQFLLKYERFIVRLLTLSQLAKQNIQARNRMIVAYELAQLSTTARNLPRAGAALLVYVSYLIRDDALDFANHTKIAMKKHTDLFTFTLSPIPVILTTKTGPGMT